MGKKATTNAKKLSQPTESKKSSAKTTHETELGGGVVAQASESKLTRPRTAIYPLEVQREL